MSLHFYLFRYLKDVSGIGIIGNYLSVALKVFSIVSLIMVFSGGLIQVYYLKFCSLLLSDVIGVHLLSDLATT